MHPVLFEIPGLGIPIYSYGVMLGTSLILAWYVVMYLGAKERIPENVLANCFIVTAVVAIAASRVLYIITNPNEFDTLRDIIDVRRGGLVAYGGFLGGFFGAWGYLRYHRVPLLSFADVAAPTLALGLGLTRIGCYMYGCDFGAPLGEGAPEWLRTLGTFPHWENGQGSSAWQWHVQHYDLPRDAAHSLPVHPTQLYESLTGFLLLGFTLAIWRVRSFRGQVLLSLAMAYGLWRFGIEYVRDDPERGEAFGFSTSQLISLAIVPLAAFFYMKQRKEQLEKPERIARLGPPSTTTTTLEAASGSLGALAEEPSAPLEPSPAAEVPTKAKSPIAATKKKKAKR